MCSAGLKQIFSAFCRQLCVLAVYVFSIMGASTVLWALLAVLCIKDVTRDEGVECLERYKRNP